MNDEQASKRLMALWARLGSFSVSSANAEDMEALRRAVTALQARGNGAIDVPPGFTPPADACDAGVFHNADGSVTGSNGEVDVPAPQAGQMEVDTFRKLPPLKELAAWWFRRREEKPGSQEASYAAALEDCALDLGAALAAPAAPMEANHRFRRPAVEELPERWFAGAGEMRVAGQGPYAAALEDCARDLKAVLAAQVKV